jgi:hypothetical protein
VSPAPFGRGTFVWLVFGQAIGNGNPAAGLPGPQQLSGFVGNRNPFVIGIIP